MRVRVFFILLLLIVSAGAGFPITVYLPKTVYTFHPAMSLASLCHAPFASNYIIPTDKSKVFSNKELGVLFQNAGYQDFTLIGSGIDLRYIPALSTSQDIIDELLALYPDAVPALKPEMLPDRFYIVKSDYAQSGNKVVVSVNYIDLTKDTGAPSIMLLTFPVLPKVELPKPASVVAAAWPTNFNSFPAASGYAGAIQTAENEVYIDSIQDYKAFIVYKLGGLTISVEARIIRKLDDVTYLVENINSGKMLIAKLIKK
ncbi:MAG: hypothetical protein HPY53_06180 [Brevinematales bacterium]|nr:hypothetical protein [Brevinematales bacterium]